MFKQNRLFLLVLCCLLALTGLTLRQSPVAAQEGGGIIIDSTFGAGPDNFNPIFCNQTDCNTVGFLIFPGTVAFDPSTNTYKKTGPNAVVKDWEVSEDGNTYTFQMRDDMKWSDGTPITSRDVVYGWNALRNEVLASPLAFLTALIDAVEAPDDYTFVVKFKGADCNALGNVASLPVLPAHHLPEDVTQLVGSPYNSSPDVTAGPFTFGEFRAGDQVGLLRNPNYADAAEGSVKADGWIYKIVPDQTVLVEQFLAGETNVIQEPPVARRAEVRAQGEAGDATVFSYAGAFWDYIALNLADPTNPQPGYDENGKVIEQGKHPIFGDKRVRQALAMLINVDDIIKGAVFGDAARMASSYSPISWAIHPTLQPWAVNPEKAGALLDEAGWPMGPDGIRVAKGAMYAPDGTPLRFELITIQGNTRRTAVGTIIKDELRKYGIDVDFQTIDFQVMTARQRAQTFDAVIGAWGGGNPANADQTQFWSIESDVPNGGSNFVSYINPEVTELMQKALTLPGCDQTERAKIYHQIQEILHDDVPYIWLYMHNGMYAAKSSVKGFAPHPGPNIAHIYHNIDTWVVENR